jgi:hypothetical protein
MTYEFRPHPDIPKVDLTFVSGLAAPLFWVLRNEDGEERFKNGTVTFIDTGSSVLAITACHVIDDCMSDSRSREFVQCMIGGDGKTLYFKLKDRLIDRNPEIDLATLRFTRDEISGIGCFILGGPQMSWPPPIPQVDYAVVLAGYPGRGRTRMDQTSMMFGRIAIGSNVSSSRDALISLHIERDQMYRCLGHGDLSDDYNFGGVSGGPVVALAERNGIRCWMAAGIILRGPNPGDDPTQQSISGLEIFQVRPVRFVKADGTLDLDMWHYHNP